MATELTAQMANQMREECKAKIILSDALYRLEGNPDFRLICEEYLEKEPARLVHLLADANMNLGGKKEIHREEIKERMIGAARFSEFMRNIHMLAERASKTIEDLNNAEIVKE